MTNLLVRTKLRHLSLIGLAIGLIFGLSAWFLTSAQATSEASPPDEQTASTPRLVFFWGEGCPHCQKEKLFLDQLATKYPQLEIESHEIYYDEKNRALMLELGRALGIEPRGVPLTIVGERYFEGFASAESTGAQIEAAVKPLVAKVVLSTDVTQASLTSAEPVSQGELEAEARPESALASMQINLPGFGPLSLATFSLPLLTIVIGALDGFNPCAMWALIFLIGILVKIKDRRRMWVLGLAFVFTSAFVYFLFLTAWLNVFLFVGYIWWLRLLIGLVALGAGAYYWYDAYRNREGACQVSQGEGRQRVFARLRAVTENKRFLVALVGIITLAVAVNLLELVCSAGLPAIYTQVLALSELPTWQYYGYLFLYLLVFMLDDLIVLLVAMTTLRVTGAQGKYARYSHWVGGGLMLLLGLLLIFKPEWLMFG